MVLLGLLQARHRPVDQLRRQAWRLHGRTCVTGALAARPRRTEWTAQQQVIRRADIRSGGPLVLGIGGGCAVAGRSNVEPATGRSDPHLTPGPPGQSAAAVRLSARPDR